VWPPSGRIWIDSDGAHVPHVPHVPHVLVDMMWSTWTTQGPFSTSASSLRAPERSTGPTTSRSTGASVARPLACQISAPPRMRRGAGCPRYLRQGAGCGGASPPLPGASYLNPFVLCGAWVFSLMYALLRPGFVRGEKAAAAAASAAQAAQAARDPAGVQAAARP
jgi:hypothetical protein